MVHIISQRGLTLVTGKLARILGLVGGTLTLLPYIFTIFLCISTLARPDNQVHFESQGYAYGFLMLSSVPALFAAAGFIGSFFVRKKHTLSGVMMTTSGMFLLLTRMPIASLGLGILTTDTAEYIETVGYILHIPPLLLIATGVLSLVYQPASISHHEPGSDGPED